MENYEVRAAGAVVIDGEAEDSRVLVIHRPGREDWSLPKGKLDRGECEEDAAVREVLEETGYEILLGDSIGTVTYRDRKDRSKIVNWWVATVVNDQGFEPNDEVDDRRWMTVDEALTTLTYERDRELLGRVMPAHARG